MQDGAYFIWPATTERDDEGHIRGARDAELYENGTERVWRFDTTAQAREAADLWWGITEWERDDRGTLWSKGGW